MHMAGLQQISVVHDPMMRDPLGENQASESVQVKKRACSIDACSIMKAQHKISRPFVLPYMRVPHEFGSRVKLGRDFKAFFAWAQAANMI